MSDPSLPLFALFCTILMVGMLVAFIMWGLKK